MLQLQQCSFPCISLPIQLEIKNNVHEIKQSSLPQQLHVALDDNQLLHLFRVQGGPLGGHKSVVTPLRSSNLR